MRLLTLLIFALSMAAQESVNPSTPVPSDALTAAYFKADSAAQAGAARIDALMDDIKRVTAEAILNQARVLLNKQAAIAALNAACGGTLDMKALEAGDVKCGEKTEK